MARAQARSVKHKVHQHGTANKRDGQSTLNQKKSDANNNKCVVTAHGSQLNVKQEIRSQGVHVKADNYDQNTQYARGNSIQGGNGPSENVYKTTVFIPHLDVGFESGAWLFNRSDAPQWLVAQLPRESSTARTPMKSNFGRPKKQIDPSNINGQVYKQTSVNGHPDVGFESGAWLFDRSAAPQWLVSQLPQVSTPARYQVNTILVRAQKQKNSSIKGHVYKPTTVKNYDPDIGFESGAWLFDHSAAPHWLASQFHENLKYSVYQTKAQLHTQVKPKHIPIAAVKKHSTSSAVQSHFENHQSKSFILKPYFMWADKSLLLDAFGSPVLEHQTSSPSAKVDTALKSGAYVIKDSTTYRHIKKAAYSNKNGLCGPNDSYLQDDTSFESGSWIFDPSSAPSWLLAQLPQSRSSSTNFQSKKIRVQSSIPTSKPEKHRKTGGCNPNLFQPKTSKDNPNIGFESGEWLFDKSAGPQWFVSQVSPVSSSETSCTRMKGDRHISSSKTSRHRKSTSPGSTWNVRESPYSNSRSESNLISASVYNRNQQHPNSDSKRARVKKARTAPFWSDKILMCVHLVLILIVRKAMTE